MVDKDMRIKTLQSEIVNKVKAIEIQKIGKKNMASSYNTAIKTLELEKQLLLAELEDIHRAELTEEADLLLHEEEE